MPRLYPQTVLQNFLTYNTIAVRLSSLDPEPVSRQCPLCHEPYGAQDPYYVHPMFPSDSEIPEYPVRVKGRDTCRHIFGRRCIEKHIQANQPWSHTCPLCRTEWFPPSRQARPEAISRLDVALNSLARIDTSDPEIAQEVHITEQALNRILEILHRSRWI